LIHAITLFDVGIQAGEELESQFEESIKGETQPPIKRGVDFSEFHQKVVEYLSRVLEMKIELIARR